MAELWQLFITFLKIGAFTFGGGYAMIPLITNAVMQHQWLGVQEITDIVAISQMTPGPLAINAATFTGIKVSGLVGGLVATAAVSLTCICITMVVSKYFFQFQHNQRVRGTLYMIRPVVVGMIFAATITIAFTAFFSLQGTMGIMELGQIQRVSYVSIGIAVLSFWWIHCKNKSPIAMIGISAALGIVGMLIGLE